MKSKECFFLKVRQILSSAARQLERKSRFYFNLGIRFRIVWCLPNPRAGNFDQFYRQAGSVIPPRSNESGRAAKAQTRPQKSQTRPAEPISLDFCIASWQIACCFMGGINSHRSSLVSCMSVGTTITPVRQPATGRRINFPRTHNSKRPLLSASVRTGKDSKQGTFGASARGLKRQRSVVALSRARALAPLPSFPPSRLRRPSTVVFRLVAAASRSSARRTSQRLSTGVWFDEDAFQVGPGVHSRARGGRGLSIRIRDVGAAVAPIFSTAAGAA